MIGLDPARPASAHPARRRQIPLAEQRRRMAELDALRLTRKLTADEMAEADNLTARAYMRGWRDGYQQRTGHPYYGALA